MGVEVCILADYADLESAGIRRTSHIGGAWLNMSRKSTPWNFNIGSTSGKLKDEMSWKN